MAGAEREYYLEVVRDALAILEAEGADHLVIGSVAVRALLGRPLDEGEDVDVLIRVDDRERLLDAFARRGYSTRRRDERWIYKAARPDVTLDLIFRAAERIELDAEHLRRASRIEVDGLALRVPAPEDVVVMKAAFDAEDRPGAWYDALAVLRRCQPMDWDYLTARAGAMPRRALSLLLYAVDGRIDVPPEVISNLVDAIGS